MDCRYCGKRIWRRWANPGDEFCSAAHQDLYQRALKGAPGNADRVLSVALPSLPQGRIAEGSPGVIDFRRSSVLPGAWFMAPDERRAIVAPFCREPVPEPASVLETAGNLEWSTTRRMEPVRLDIPSGWRSAERGQPRLRRGHWLLEHPADRYFPPRLKPVQFLAANLEPAKGCFPAGIQADLGLPVLTHGAEREVSPTPATTHPEPRRGSGWRRYPVGRAWPLHKARQPVRSLDQPECLYELQIEPKGNLPAAQPRATDWRPLRPQASMRLPRFHYRQRASCSAPEAIELSTEPAGPARRNVRPEAFWYSFTGLVAPQTAGALATGATWKFPADPRVRVDSDLLLLPLPSLAPIEPARPAQAPLKHLEGTELDGPGLPGVPRGIPIRSALLRGATPLTIALAPDFRSGPREAFWWRNEDARLPGFAGTLIPAHRIERLVTESNRFQELPSVVFEGDRGGRWREPAVVATAAPIPIPLRPGMERDWRLYRSRIKPEVALVVCPVDFTATAVGVLRSMTPSHTEYKHDFWPASLEFPSLGSRLPAPVERRLEPSCVWLAIEPQSRAFWFQPAQAGRLPAPSNFRQRSAGLTAQACQPLQPPPAVVPDVRGPSSIEPEPLPATHHRRKPNRFHQHGSALRFGGSITGSPEPAKLRVTLPPDPGWLDMTACIRVSPVVSRLAMKARAPRGPFKTSGDFALPWPAESGISRLRLAGETPQGNSGGLSRLCYVTATLKVDSSRSFRIGLARDLAIRPSPPDSSAGHAAFRVALGIRPIVASLGPRMSCIRMVALPPCVPAGDYPDAGPVPGSAVWLVGGRTPHPGPERVFDVRTGQLAQFAAATVNGWAGTAVPRPSGAMPMRQPARSAMWPSAGVGATRCAIREPGPQWGRETWEVPGGNQPVRMECRPVAPTSRHLDLINQLAPFAAATVNGCAGTAVPRPSAAVPTRQPARSAMWPSAGVSATRCAIREPGPQWSMATWPVPGGNQPVRMECAPVAPTSRHMELIKALGGWAELPVPRVGVADTQANESLVNLCELRPFVSSGQRLREIMLHGIVPALRQEADPLPLDLRMQRKRKLWDRGGRWKYPVDHAVTVPSLSIKVIEPAVLDPST